MMAASFDQKEIVIWICSYVPKVLTVAISPRYRGVKISYILFKNNSLPIEMLIQWLMIW